jgi:hypothetical protein
MFRDNLINIFDWIFGMWFVVLMIYILSLFWGLTTEKTLQIFFTLGSIATYVMILQEIQKERDASVSR